ncbi:LLM class F420-dependent oxidoreductase [Aldersonia kunmingensis]|uniref:LLM class F420-dependent oxidoreductase n=1 Tax=Aldersonia kunmingensis TaxID=408066 RepID=UPI000832228F|nr:LLM class F420-dependent oxidoreductase [Aldersonia kunmingensis]
MSIRLGYQIPNFSYGTPVSELFPTVLAQAREAESAGFDAVLVMDHFYQLPGIGTPDQPMLESYTALAGIATATERIQLSTLVTGNTYRNPAMLAKTVTTLDVVSGGRAVLGIGAGWFELEHNQLGYEFGTFTDRFERLDEALQIIDPMLRGQRPTFEGKWYRTENAMNEPRFRDDLPILIGGSGEKKSFGLAARYAQHLNIICGLDEIPRKRAALDERLKEVGREHIETSYLATVILDEDGDKARAVQLDAMRARGFDVDSLSAEELANLDPRVTRMFVGSPDEVAKQIQERVLAHGIDGVIINMIANGHQPGIVELAGKALAPLVR